MRSVIFGIGHACLFYKNLCQNRLAHTLRGAELPIDTLQTDSVQSCNSSGKVTDLIHSLSGIRNPLTLEGLSGSFQHFSQIICHIGNPLIVFYIFKGSIITKVYRTESVVVQEIHGILHQLLKSPAAF